jgi:hypothetical protein
MKINERSGSSGTIDHLSLVNEIFNMEISDQDLIIDLPRKEILLKE